MDDARAMYQEHILELYRYPLNFGSLENPSHEHTEYNPLCGDKVTIQLMINDGKIDNVKFTGEGCAISIAAASLVTESVKGKTVEEVRALGVKEILELLEIPIGPVRLKCALLSLETVHKAVRQC